MTSDQFQNTWHVSTERMWETKRFPNAFLRKTYSGRLLNSEEIEWKPRMVFALLSNWDHHKFLPTVNYFCYYGRIYKKLPKHGFCDLFLWMRWGNSCFHTCQCSVSLTSKASTAEKEIENKMTITIALLWVKRSMYFFIHIKFDLTFTLHFNLAFELKFGCVILNCILVLVTSKALWQTKIDNSEFYLVYRNF